jgi:hypothetical protein
VLSCFTLGFCGCNTENFERAGQCFGAAIGSAIGEGLGDSFARLPAWLPRGPDPMRPDEAKVTDAGVTFISVLHEGCRLQLLFDGPVQPGSLPRIDDTCLVRDRATFMTTDGGYTSVALEVASVEQTRTDAGVRLLLDCVGLERRLRDGGAEPLPDRRIDVVAIVQ